MIKVCPICGKEFKTSHQERIYCSRECAKTRFNNLIGQRFGRLIVIEKTSTSEPKGGIIWKCQCDCGNIITVSTTRLKQNNVRSCGCLQRETSADRLHKHGLSRNRIYRIHNHIKDRCLNPKSHAYKSYGGRGITICDEWLNDVTAFYNWAINNGYSDDLTIDRINNNGNYEPSNCRWATKKEQSNNTRSNHYYVYNGEKHTITEWARKIGVEPQKVYDKMRYHTLEEIIDNHCKT